MLENRSEQHQQVVDKFIDPNATVHMTVRDYVSRPSADNISGPIIQYLPPVNEAKGRFYAILVRDASAVNTVTIADLDDSECWLADIVFDAPCRRALFYSDGLSWHVMGLAGEWPGLTTTIAPATDVTTAAPTTSRGTTSQATTVAPTTEAPTTAAPTTLATSLAPTTAG